MTDSSVSSVKNLSKAVSPQLSQQILIALKAARVSSEVPSAATTTTATRSVFDDETNNSSKQDDVFQTPIAPIVLPNGRATENTNKQDEIFKTPNVPIVVPGGRAATDIAKTPIPLALNRFQHDEFDEELNYQHLTMSTDTATTQGNHHYNQNTKPTAPPLLLSSTQPTPSSYHSTQQQFIYAAPTKTTSSTMTVSDHPFVLPASTNEPISTNEPTSTFEHTKHQRKHYQHSSLSSSTSTTDTTLWHCNPRRSFYTGPFDPRFSDGFTVHDFRSVLNDYYRGQVVRLCYYSTPDMATTPGYVQISFVKPEFASDMSAHMRAAKFFACTENDNNNNDDVDMPFSFLGSGAQVESERLRQTHVQVPGNLADGKYVMLTRWTTGENKVEECDMNVNMDCCKLVRISGGQPLETPVDTPAFARMAERYSFDWGMMPEVEGDEVADWFGETDRASTRSDMNAVEYHHRNKRARRGKNVEEAELKRECVDAGLDDDMEMDMEMDMDSVKFKWTHLQQQEKGEKEEEEEKRREGRKWRGMVRNVMRRWAPTENAQQVANSLDKRDVQRGKTENRNKNKNRNRNRNTSGRGRPHFSMRFGHVVLERE